jgi:hypothetical protein
VAELDAIDADEVESHLARLFTEMARAAGRRAPLYRRLGEAIAEDPAVSRLLLHAPPDQRLPVLLLACVHWILLREPEHELRRWYPNLVPEPDRSDPYPAFREFCRREAHQLSELLATRSTQTNEVGRCAIFVPLLAELADEVGPLAHLDVGASAGLNLLLDRYQYRFRSDDGSTTTVGDPSPVVIECETRGPVPVPSSLPPIIDRLGLDRSPVDVGDRDTTAWLQACVWPDQADRFERLGAALELARVDRPPIVSGDAVDQLAGAVDRLDPDGHAVVTNSWVLNYLGEDRRLDYVAELDRLGASRDLTWCCAESPMQTSGLPFPVGLDRPELTHLIRVDWRLGHRTVRHVAVAHPHGFWLHWT